MIVMARSKRTVYEGNYCMEHYSEGLASCKRDAKKAARGLKYGDDVIAAINDARTESQVNQIMREARHKKFK